MVEGLETVAFLASSENRVRVLSALTDQPRDRADLREETGTTRATLGRVLGELEDRGLVRRQGSTYEASPAGRALWTAFHPAVETATALDTLGDVATWFPFDDVGFAPRHLHDARVVRPTKTDAIRPINRSLDLIGAADHIRLVASHHAPPALEAFAERVETDGLRMDAVMTREALDLIGASENDTRNLRTVVESPTVTAAVTDVHVPYNVAANDDTIVITVSDDSGAPQAIVESEASAVTEWFDEFFEDHCERATPITVDDLAD